LYFLKKQNILITSCQANDYPTMENNPAEIPSDALQNYLNTPELLRDLLEQLMKDFQTAHLPLALDVAYAYTFDELKDRLIETLSEHARTPRALQQLMYRVDVSEGQLRRRINSQSGNTLPQIAELIIKRELQKVVIRHWYKRA
jgi:hypothetical protein